MIKPHGGILINGILPSAERAELLKKIDGFKKLKLNFDSQQDVQNIAKGAYSPLAGFLKKEDFQGVLANMKLKEGTPWPIPVVLDVNKEDYSRLKNEKDIILTDDSNEPVAILRDIEIYEYDKEELAKNVFKTLDQEHPGVKGVYEMGDYLVGGEVGLIKDCKAPFEKHNLSPQETRKIFEAKNWNTIVAFQTRNIPHRSHEHLQKTAMENTDGLFVQPVIGKKKPGDFKDDLILKTYEAIIDKYFPKERVHLGVLPLKMRYAGPREAIFHAIIRKNFGCSHFIVGRDHAGVGNYYGPYDAQNIFNDFPKEELDIEILKYENVVYCKECKGFVMENSCSHLKESKLSLSGTKVREMVKNKENLPSQFVRPEVADLLISHPNPFV